MCESERCGLSNTSSCSVTADLNRQGRRRGRRIVGVFREERREISKVRRNSLTLKVMGFQKHNRRKMRSDLGPPCPSIGLCVRCFEMTCRVEAFKRKKRVEA